MTQHEVTAIVEQTIREFGLSFLRSPYLCYTEHGLHALFYTMLYNALMPEEHQLTWNNHKLHILQN